MTTEQYSPGDLLRARGRDWIVLHQRSDGVLRVRPISGSEADQTLLHLGLERSPVTSASFPDPTPAQVASHDSAILLRDALLLTLRRGAGPFRSAGQIAVAPRAYQLVPLLMALKLEVVRLLIADDVGIGKTVEAALILRELVDRGDIDRFTVLCPPHLVDQWVTELDDTVHLRAVAVTAHNAARLEQAIPQGDSIFRAHPFTVVSLDYIKNDRRRGEFLRACPGFVVVDEAHTCAGGGRGQQKRFQLLRELADAASRQMVLLTATPHSGDEGAFYRLLGLLDPAFESLPTADEETHKRLRERLARHLVQRRRPDIAEWQEGVLFPRRETTEVTYALSGAWDRFFRDVLTYCASAVRSAKGDERHRRMNFWSTLALMRCVASSPAAAVLSLRTRAGEVDDLDALEGRVFDGVDDELSEDDVEPPAAGADPVLDALVRQAEALMTKGGDPKVNALAEHVTALVADGFRPVVFCRYIATARYVAAELTRRLKGVRVSTVTGELTPDERRTRIDALDDHEDDRVPVLVCTDCLSEGINLQHQFNAVVHYDLSWNPTRHEQREGRVDRYGQRDKVVRATLLYGKNNPVDGAVLQVILRKAAEIRRVLGVPVPLPDDHHALTEALLRAVLLREHDPRQMSLELAEAPEAAALTRPWRDAAETAKRTNTLFAQRRIKPEEVMAVWSEASRAVGGAVEVERFVRGAFARYGTSLAAARHGLRAPLGALPPEVRERLAAEGLQGTLAIDFTHPPASRCRFIHRSHPLVSTLAESLLERTLAASSDDAGARSDAALLGRAGAWVSPAVARQTVVLLLRMRHQLVVVSEGKTTQLLVEEAGALAWVGSDGTESVEGDAAVALLLPAPVGDLPDGVRTRRLTQGLLAFDTLRPLIVAYAKRRAAQLADDHRGVRDASDARGSYTPRALEPVDVIGYYLLLPPVDGAS